MSGPFKKRSAANKGKGPQIKVRPQGLQRKINNLDRVNFDPRADLQKKIDKLHEERDMAKEAKWAGSREQVIRRMARNRARQKAIREGRASKGDGKEVHHMGSHRKGSLDSVPTKVVSRHENRTQQPKRK